MAAIIFLCLLTAFSQADATREAASFFQRGQTFGQFLETVSAQRELWLRNAASATTAPEDVGRLKRVRSGLRFLIVAEDWCPDSVNTVPYIVRLGELSGVDVRLVHRNVGQPLMARHRTPDGRTATPTVVLLRNDRDVGAWVERPAALQQLFLSMGTHPEMGRRLAERQSWYDEDRGQTTLSEVLALAEQTAPRQ